MKISQFAKTVVAAVGSVVTVATAAFADDVLGVDETGTLVSTLVTAALTVYAVYRKGNAPRTADTWEGRNH